MSHKLISTIAGHHNICNFIHLPVQSGSDRVLELMNRTYSREHYLNLVRKIRSEIPDANLSTDIITGFPTETEDDHRMTLDMMAEVRYDGAFTFKYSPRENTPAFSMSDDVAEDIKTRRINEIIALQQKISLKINQEQVGKNFEILVEGESKKSPDEWQGRTDGNKMVVFPKGNYRQGDYIHVQVERANSATLFGFVNENSMSETKEVAA
jgi:tRNA-2-methylthio-N6-dimethylallyladenosine synthase